MKVALDPASVRHALHALEVFPHRVRFRHVRIGLNAAGGHLRKLMRELAPIETGTLKKSFAVKVKIPDTSYNRAHHGKPAYVVIGANRQVVAPFLRLPGPDKVLSIRRATKRVLGGGKVEVRKPSRYLHLANRRTRFMSIAANLGAAVAQQEMIRKLRQGVTEEAAKLAATSPVR